MISLMRDETPPESAERASASWAAVGSPADRARGACFGFYGLRVRSDLALPGPAGAGLVADVCFVWPNGRTGRPFKPCKRNWIYRSLEFPRGGIELYRSRGWYCVRSVGVGDFFVSPGASLVRCYPAPAVPEPVMSTVLLGPVSALVLELRGLPCLHASCVQIGDAAVGFVGASGAGKSSVAAALVARGCALVSDDLLPVRIGDGLALALPGHAAMNVSPQAAETFIAQRDPGAALAGKLRVPVGRTWGRLAGGPMPLAAIYVLANEPRGPAAASSTLLVGTAALVELLRHSFCARVVGLLGVEAARFAALARLAAATRVRRLTVPQGLDRLAGVLGLIEQDLAGS